jgi:hypothetical protein
MEYVSGHISLLGKVLGPDKLTLLDLASLAPSGHNAQPWAVNFASPDEWIIGIDRTRWLPAVDPDNRGALLSLGAFLENLILAASPLGYRVDYEVTANSRTDSGVLRVRLKASPLRESDDVKKIEKRRSVRSNYLSGSLKGPDLDCAVSTPGCLFFPRERAEGRFLADATIEANRKQAYRDDAQQELADCIRWSPADQSAFRNGLTPKMLDIDGIAGWYVGRFYGREHVLSKPFREQGVSRASKQAREGAGWLVLEGEDSNSALVEAGRSFERLCLDARERMIAVHPMSQILEEAPWRNCVARELGLDGKPQFVLRIGYRTSFPDPVSPRMPLSRFVTAAIAAGNGGGGLALHG